MSETNGFKTMVDELKTVAAQLGLPPMPEAIARWFEVFGPLVAVQYMSFDKVENSNIFVLFRSAIMAKRLEVVAWLFSFASAGGIDVNDIKDENNGESLLHLAAHTGDVGLMGLVIERGVDVNAKDSLGRDLTYVLAHYGYIEAMEWFLKGPGIGIDIDAKDNIGWTPMFRAVQVGQVKSIEYLASLGAEINVSVMCCAATYGQIESIKCLHKLNKNLVNTKDANGMTPIFIAAFVGQVDSIKCLASLGAEVDATDNIGYTPLFKAAQAGKAECVECLVNLVEPAKRKAYVNATDSIGATVIFAAIEGNPTTIKRLVDLGAEVNVEIKGLTPVFVAAGYGNLENVQCLVELGAKLNIIAQGKTPLDAAISRGHTKVVEYLREKGAKRAAEL